MGIKASKKYTDTYTGKWINSDDEYEAKKKIKDSILKSASDFSFSASCGFDTIFASLDLLIKDWKDEELEMVFEIVLVTDDEDVTTVDSIRLKYLSL